MSKFKVGIQKCRVTFFFYYYLLSFNRFEFTLDEARGRNRALSSLCLSRLVSLFSFEKSRKMKRTLFHSFLKLYINLIFENFIFQIRSQDKTETLVFDRDLSKLDEARGDYDGSGTRTEEFRFLIEIFI